MSLNATPNANRLHITVYGRRNSGKSSLLNAITGQDTALVSEIAGTTTDPVSKAIELRGIGACVLTDTAGFDDEGELGMLRMEKTEETLQRTDLAVVVFSDGDLTLESKWITRLKKRDIPVIPVISKKDKNDVVPLETKIKNELGFTPVLVSAKTRSGIPELLEALVRNLPEGYETESITRRLVREGDIVLLVMPQDSEAPKGRLILPQVQTIRDLLDNRCISINATPESMSAALAALKAPPSLIITDSQAFAVVSQMAPKESRLTSFSVLFAAYKGDLPEFIKGADAVDLLSPSSRVLIAEACTHAPLNEDIGRVKIPALLRKKIGPQLAIDMAAGTDFPKDLSGYDLIIHCGGCMFNRKYLLSRIEAARRANVPITNYGILLAKLNGILDKITL